MSLEEELDDMLDPVVMAFRQQLTMAVGNHAIVAYLQAAAEVTSYGKALTGKPLVFEGPPMNEAVEYARKRAAQMVTKMDEETKRQLAQVVSGGIKNKRGIPGIARDIRTKFADMTKHRSNLIATTETRDALFHAAQDRYEKMGVTGKKWILGSGGKEGNCPECMANASIGAIPIDEDFPTPQDEIHPGCTCAIAPVIL